jgi:glycosyltransferase involved in cell wall biosynthesis
VRLGIDGREYQNPGSTGIGRYLSDFIDWLVAERPDVTPVVFLNQRCRYEPSSPRVETIVIPEGFTPSWDQRLLPRALRAARIDVFLSPYMKMPLFAPCPEVLIVNDLIPMRFPLEQSAHGMAQRLYFRAMIAAAVRRAARIIAISEFTRREVIDLLGVPADRVRTVHLGIRPSLHPVRDPETLRASIARNGLDTPFILYVGQLRASKNVGALIRAFALLPEALRAQNILAVGGAKTGAFAELEKLAAAPGISGRVRFLGHIVPDDLSPLMSGAALFVYPSRYEGFGFPPLEAMACGAPVVCSTATSLGEVIGAAALRVDEPNPQNLADAMQRALEDAALRDRLAAAGPPHAAQFTVERMARGFLEVIADAAGRART